MKVSIIIPIYNVEPYVEACLQSVASQTMTEGVECIVVDDCGTDQSMQIAEQFMKDYDGPILFRILHHEHNRGLSAARNTGIRAAQGEYIYFLDSDDIIKPNCIDTYYRLVEKYHIDMVQGSYEAKSIMLRDFSKLMPLYTADRSYIKCKMLDYDHYPVMAQNRLVRHSLIVNHDLFFKEDIIHEDTHWTYFLAKHIQSMVVCPFPLYKYRENPDSITGNKNKGKEVESFSVLIKDFCANIDPIEVGAQKRWILLHLLQVQQNQLYSSERDFVELCRLFSECNSMLQKKVLYSICTFPQGSWLQNKFINMLQRLYKWE